MFREKSVPIAKGPPKSSTKPWQGRTLGENEEEEDLADSGRLFVRNLPYTSTEEDLEGIFSKYGRAGPRLRRTPRARGESRQVAASGPTLPPSALDLGPMTFEVVALQPLATFFLWPTRSSGPTHSPAKARHFSVPSTQALPGPQVTAPLLSAGPLSELHYPIDSLTKKPKGFAFVTFMFPEHAVKAYAEVDGQVFQVTTQGWQAAAPGWPGGPCAWCACAPSHR